MNEKKRTLWERKSLGGKIEDNSDCVNLGYRRKRLGIIDPIRIGNGLHTRFWKDLWIGDCILSSLFPRLFTLDTMKDISVAGKLQSPLVSYFRHNVRGGIEEQQLEHLVALLDFVILSNSNDRWVSDLNGDGVFRVKDVGNLLDEFFLPRADVPT
nr:RNA-directed DNA polymerase, eukaryota [Tanacetum cinerariifolium]